MDLKKLTRLSGLLALAVVLGYLENLMPLFNGTVPGLKIGLANVIILMILYIYGAKEALMVSILRVFLVSLISSGIFSVPFFFSLGGALASILIMVLAKRYTKLSILGISVLGSIFHSMGQIIMAIILLQMPSLVNYLPWLIAFSIPTGIFVGVLARYFTEYYEKRLKNNID